MKKAKILWLVSGLLLSATAFADERAFTYVYEANVLPEGEYEIEQYVTNQNGKEDGDYSRWNFRTEFEWGVTDHYMSAIYMNWDSTRSEGVTGVDDERGSEFKGFSWENIYQIMNPNIDPVGLAAYLELTSDAVDYEIESKLIVSKPIGDLILAANATYEAEWEREDGRTAKEGTLEFTMGGSYKVAPHWSVGLEVRNKSAFPDGLDLNGREFTEWSVGPNVHYGSPKWWATFTVLPQVWGNGDGSHNNRQLVHEESVEARAIVGFNFQ